MVLSNKKLKQKLRAEAAESTQPTQQPPESLKPLLDSAAQKPRLSKREKRRETPLSSGTANKESDPVTNTKKRKKRDENDGVLKETKESDQKKKNPKKKKKSKKMKEAIRKKKKKMSENEEKKEPSVAENEEKKATVTNVKVEISQPIESSATKVYVGGIPYYSTEDDIRSYFESCGTITEVDCMTFPESGKFRGIAIISFRTETAAKRALALDGSDMGGLFLTIQPFKTNRAIIKAPDFAPRVVEGYNRVYIGNLSWDITEDVLKSFFSDCNISSIRFGTNKDSGEFRGYAHVDFSDALSFTMALKLDQKIVLGRPAKISCAVPLKKAKTSHDDSATIEIVPIEVIETEKEEEEQKEKETEIVGPAPLLGSAEPGLASVSTGKIRRRTCYVCGEKGHISSECPKSTAEPVVVAAPPVEPKEEIVEPAPVVGYSANAGSSSVSAGKMRRRTCYECGEKGHLSSDCPTVKDGNKL